jgi:ATP-dependent Clp protease, proteolytic subunit ClpP
MAVLKIYNEITTEEDKQFLKWCMGMDGVCFKDIDEFLSGMDEKDNTVDIRLHCDGGSVSEGWAIYDKLRASGKEISAIAEGKVASMATIIMMAAPKERRKAYKSANICVHNPWVPSYALGDSLTAEDLRKTAEGLQKEQDKMLDLYVERCECNRDEMQSLMNEDKFIDTDRAKALGIISEIIAPASAKKGSNNNNFNNMAKTGNVEVKQNLLDKLLGKLGYSKIEDVALGMDLSTADGGTLTVEREEGEPQVGDVASPDGEHVMPDGSIIVVADGKITEIKPASSGDGEEGGSDEETRITELETEVEELKTEIDELKEELEGAKAKAKTSSDLAILNAVKMVGGEKWLAKNCSTFKVKVRTVSGANARKGIEGSSEETPMEREIRERKEGTYNKKK